MSLHTVYFHNGDKVTDNVCPPKKKITQCDCGEPFSVYFCLLLKKKKKVYPVILHIKFY